MKKVPRELELEELLKALESAPENVSETSTEYRNDLLAFLSFYNLQNGNEKVNKTLIKRMYREWSDDPIEGRLLDWELGKLLTQCPTDSRCYLVNEKAINLAASAYKYLLGRKHNKTKSPFYKKHFDRFLSSHGIKKGQVWMPAFVLFHLYDKWTYKNKSHRTMSQEYFMAFCNLYFERKRVKGTYYWYRVDESIYNHITKEQVSDMIETRKLYGKRRQRTKKEKKDQVS
jgi:hypothetical protein